MTTPAQPSIHVLLADSYPAIREALALLLKAEGLTVCAAVGTRAQALAAADANPPDLALVDLSLDEDDGLLLIADLHARGVPVVVCSSQEGPVPVRRALAAGAQAYVAKREAGQVLGRVVAEVLAGWMLVSPRAAAEP